ncbi:MAG TPA: hypothetical protein VMR28_03285 [Candidatus Saccharimonadales bacterium]|nr:hypothetical protein [Candidatus Saccharimonadales bacterium]
MSERQPTLIFGAGNARRRNRFKGHLNIELSDDNFPPVQDHDAHERGYKSPLTLSAVEVSKYAGRDVSSYEARIYAEPRRGIINASMLHRYVTDSAVIMNDEQRGALRYLNSEAAKAVDLLPNPEQPDQTFAGSYIFGLKMMQASGKINIFHALPLSFKDIVSRRFYAHDTKQFATEVVQSTVSTVYNLAQVGIGSQEALCLFAASPDAQNTIGPLHISDSEDQWKVNDERSRHIRLTQAGIGLAHLHCRDVLMDSVQL